MQQAKIVVVGGEARKLNWAPALKHRHEIKYALAGKPLPEFVDLRSRCSPIAKQGTIGSCSAHAMAGADEFLQMEEIRLNLPPCEDPQEYIQNTFVPASRMFIYYAERELEGSTGSDSGVTTLRDGCKAVCGAGVPRESIWPYWKSLLFAKPSAAAYAEAAQHRVKSYLAINDLAGLKDCLASGNPAAFGFAVYSSFISQEVALNGEVPMPSASESLEGGHAVLAVGYDDRRNWVIVRNSWGPDWGHYGYFFLPFEFFTEGLASDIYTLRR